MSSGNRIAGAVWLLVLCWAALDARARDPRPRDRRAHPDTSLFAHSEDCQACHNNLTSPGGDDVSIGVAWRATMMANSSRDPSWQAAVRRETSDHPSHAGAIQDECAGCHMPMAAQIARAGSRLGEVFAHLPPAGAKGAPLARLAADGVSCTVCHQMAADGLGTRQRFNGRFAVTAPRPDGIRRVYGPYEIDAGRRTIMRSVTGYEQVQGPHIQGSEMCASCHTLITQTLGPDGKVIGSLPEQMNYQEWQHSAFPAERKGCQSCHMPRVSGPVRISSVLGDTRETLAQHRFVGGNAHMLGILSRFRGELGVAASAAELDAAAAATVTQLQHETAELSVTPPGASGGTLTFVVSVRNLTGHKFPTGYPARRAWLHVVVTDDSGERVFESGAPGRDGSIEGNDGDANGASFEPHYTLITRSDQVQIYEPILGDRSGTTTTGLLTATHYLKDNRLLPRGFDKETAVAEIAVVGTARDDPDFAAGGDGVRYAISAPPGRALTVRVSLLYQAIAYRWAHGLDGYDAPEPRRFLSYFRQTVSDSTVRVASAEARAASAEARAGSAR